jgi:hypothetical protein
MNNKPDYLKEFSGFFIAAGPVCRVTSNMAASVPPVLPFCGGVPGHRDGGGLDERATGRLKTILDTLQPWNSASSGSIPAKAPLMGHR